MAAPQDDLKWSAQYQVARTALTSKLQGDKITLPPSALEALLAAAPVVSVNSGSSRPYTSSFDPFNPYTFAAEQAAREQLGDRQQQLPHPLTFRLVNPQNGRVVYAGIREFSAEENEVGLSSVLQTALGLGDGSSAVTREQTPNGDVEMHDAGIVTPQTITVHAKQLPKGSYVRLRPLEAGYDPEDWKSLLERYLRDNFTTLTNGEVLSIRSGRHDKYQFLVDKLEPDGEGICIVDTDLEVDIEALNEEQARETLSRRLEKGQRTLGTKEGSSAGGTLLLEEEQAGQVLTGGYVDYEVKTWDRGKGIEFDLEIGQDDAELDLFVSPFSPRLRAEARDDEHVFGDFSSRPSKRIRLSATNAELDDAEALYISVHAYRDEPKPTTSSRPISYILRATQTNTEPENTNLSDPVPANPNEVICKNCHQSIPKRTLPLHEAFCYRNNVLCPHCHQVFLKSSPAWKNHWHCPYDSFYGDNPQSRAKHDQIFHPASPYLCPNCDFKAPSLPALASHRTTICPGKEILCQFCHLIVPQQGPDDPSFTDPEVLMSGLTPHELADSARTTECHLCGKIVRLRDMKTHLRLHDRERLSRPRPRICRNALCGRTLNEPVDRKVKQQLGLCDECFGPLYVTSYDPEGKALRRRVERRILQQLMAGCGKVWCANNQYCRTGHKNVTGEDRSLTAKDALPLVKPLIDTLESGGPLYFCVDEASQGRRTLARNVAEMGEYEEQWWVKAMEETRASGAEGGVEEHVRRAREWLEARAPRIGEVAT
jgi:Ubiquitin fusion degradation protein UFD1